MREVMNSPQSSPSWSQQPDFDAPALLPIPLTTQEKVLRNILRDKGYLSALKGPLYDQQGRNQSGPVRLIVICSLFFFLTQVHWVPPSCLSIHTSVSHTHTCVTAGLLRDMAGTEGFWEILMWFVAISKAWVAPKAMLGAHVAFPWDYHAYLSVWFKYSLSVNVYRVCVMNYCRQPAIFKLDWLFLLAKTH